MQCAHLIGVQFPVEAASVSNCARLKTPLWRQGRAIRAAWHPIQPTGSSAFLRPPQMSDHLLRLRALPWAWDENIGHEPDAQAVTSADCDREPPPNSSASTWSQLCTVVFTVAPPADQLSNAGEIRLCFGVALFSSHP